MQLEPQKIKNDHIFCTTDIHSSKPSTELYEGSGMWAMKLIYTYRQLCCLRGQEHFQNIDREIFYNSQYQLNIFNRLLSTCIII